ncbi:RNA polymerase factor sigma-54 [Flavihumibacter cheonanensis]|uniref:RNA polymerase factor sigma-54 n=1 Tax=Flavihumibacter cheonanensis TaxID=1442385 RepID=UPI001EF932A9|nr:RNA polymerase factor sigma-54 [Flavihumibacter cheonanensis]MCG7752727.1 RNA polymerase factor sigma-54 [Flavihumibacter cheonanensis]
MISQNQSQQQTQKILPQQIQLLNLFQYNSQELLLHIRQELEQNPYLEEVAEHKEDAGSDEYNREAAADYKDWEEYADNDVPDYKVEYANYFNESDMPERPLAAQVDFREAAKGQLFLLNLSDREIAIGNYLIDCLEETGLLEKDMETIADDFSFSQFLTTPEEIESVLNYIQQLEPLGIGARSIGESWLLQLQAKKKKSLIERKAIELLANYYEEFKNRRFEKLMDKLDLEESEFRELVLFLSKLPMRPVAGDAHSLSPKNNIVPDVEISRNGEDFTITVCGIHSEQFRMSDSLQENMDQTKDKAALQYLRSKMQSANWLLYAIKQRNESIMKITKAILQMQEAYFEEGDINKLQPMVLKHIADKVGLDISTVSRLTSNKYAQTPFGTIHLKELFTEGIENKEGEVISNRVIRHALEEVIEREDKRNPYTDQQLVGILLNKGFKVARRTVAKYRDLLHIPVAQVRAIWA